MFEIKLSSKDLKGAIVGMLLGDASIPKLQGRASNNYLSICHCQEHVDYLIYKKSIIEQLTPTRFYENQPNGKNGKYLRCRMDTRAHQLYTEMRNICYPKEKKTITTRMMNLLTPLGFGLWYQDDGCLTNHENFNQPILCTHGFTKTENDLMSRYLIEKFGLDWRLRKDKSYYCLALIRKDRERFFELISPFVVDCMRYKITPKIDTKAVVWNEKLSFRCEICGDNFKKDYKHRFEANRFCSQFCYGKSKKNLIGNQIIPLSNGRFINEHGHFISKNKLKIKR